MATKTRIEKEAKGIQKWLIPKLLSPEFSNRGFKAYNIAVKEDPAACKNQWLVRLILTGWMQKYNYLTGLHFRRVNVLNTSKPLDAVFSNLKRNVSKWVQFSFRLRSKEGLIVRARHVHFICPSLSPILRRLEELLLGSGVLQSCRIHHTRKACLPRPYFTTSCLCLAL